MVKKRAVLILRGALFYGVALFLAKSSFMFDMGFDPTHIFQALITAILIAYRFFVFAIAPVLILHSLVLRVSDRGAA